MKQTSIWDSPAEIRPTLELYQPDAKTFKYWDNELSRIYTVPELEERIDTFRPLIKGRTVVALSSEGKKLIAKEIADLQNKKSNIRKYEQTAFLAFFLADLRNFWIYLESLPEDIQLLWRLVFDNYFISHNQLKQQTGKALITEIDTAHFYSYRSVIVSKELAWFQCTEAKTFGVNHYGYSNIDHYFHLPTWLHERLNPLFFPKEACTPVRLSELPDAAPLNIFNGETPINQEFPIIESMGKQGTLELSKNKMTISVFKKATQLANMAEFFPEHADWTVNHLRSSLVLPLYPLFRQLLHTEGQTMEDTLRTIFKSILRYPGITIPALLPHVTGLRGNIVQNSYASRIANDILSIFISLNTREWISIAKLIAGQRLHSPLVYTNLFSLDHFEKQDIMNKKCNHPIYLDKMYTEMSIPFIKSFFFLLAAYGLVEVAYTDFDDNSPSYFCSLRYIRLTPLGAYVFEKEKEYAPPVNKDETIYFELDPQNLIIRSLQENNPYESLLSDTAQPIGYHRYRVSAESFLKNCINERDVDNKINFFRQYIHSDPPELWESFFKSLQLRCHPLQSIPNSRYAIYQVEAGNKELQKLLSTDPVIRKYTVRAENYLLLIEVKYQKQVIDRLKSFGYLL